VKTSHQNKKSEGQTKNKPIFTSSVYLPLDLRYAPLLTSPKKKEKISCIFVNRVKETKAYSYTKREE